MSNAIAKQSSQALMGSGTAGQTPWELMWDQASVLVKSGFLPAAIKTPEQAIAIILAGDELGLPKMLALRSIHIINGRPTLSADLMASLVQREIDRHRDGEFRVLPPDVESCTVNYRRWGWLEGHSYTYTIEDAKRAGLAGKETWKAHPAAMLRARATAAVCRMAFPDVVAGLYAPEELEAGGFAEGDDGPRLSVIGAHEPEQINSPADDVSDPVGALGIDTRDGRLVDHESGEIGDAPVEQQIVDAIRTIQTRAKRAGWDRQALTDVAGTIGVDVRGLSLSDATRLHNEVERLIAKAEAEQDAALTEPDQAGMPIDADYQDVEGEAGNDKYSAA